MKSWLPFEALSDIIMKKSNKRRRSMNLANNLYYLRKHDKITQEELADKLGVSRQSVSKWETGEAYPETEKLIALCDLFHVSLDELVRGEIKGLGPTVPDQTISSQASAYGAHMDSFSKKIAAGVFFILFGVALCVALSGISLFLGKPLSDLIAVMGAVVLLLFIAVAVFLFVYSGIAHDKFRNEHPTVETCYSPAQTEAFSKRFALAMACLVSAILLDTVFLVTFCALIEAEILFASHPEQASCFVVATFLFLLSLIVGGLVYYGIQHTKYHVTEYNNQSESDSNQPRKKWNDTICGVIMLLATALFLLLGFVWNLWHPGWVVFPIGGILCGIISTILHVKDD